jgi:hypothetical protein
MAYLIFNERNNPIEMKELFKKLIYDEPSIGLFSKYLADDIRRVTF